ncbi:MAG TPA: alpha/beta fold hydrolase [Polyangiaceae bacterium]|jgi:pimeloyl-ACP methyl ester carboxylesterase|nr:alpha/beta fold hydrolase [Polyangiaceae bacterium]
MFFRRRLALCSSLLALTPACSSDGAKHAGNDGGDVAADGGNASLDGGGSESCDATKRPILFVHGIMGGADNFELQAQRFTSNGYCRSAIRGFDYDATFLAFGGAVQSDTDDTEARLDAAVDAFRKDTGFDKLDLVGHSYGTLMSATYLKDAAHAAKIEHYAQAAGGGVAEPVPQVNLSSDGDFVAGNPKKLAMPGPDGESVENPDIGYHDHVAVLSCKESFAAMYQLFNGNAPTAPDVVSEGAPQISGFYKNFSDNTPHAGITIGIYEVDADTGDRLHDQPDFHVVTGDDGSWGPFTAKAGARYEFFMPEAGEPPADGKPGRPQHTYRGPFRRSTHLMYLKALPKLGSFAANIIAGHIMYSDAKSGFIIQNGSRAMISKADPGGHGNDSLTIEGTEALTADVAPEKLQLIALFGFDNGQTEFTPVTTLSSPFFLSAVDVSLPTSEKTPVKFVFDGVTVNVHRWKSDTEGSSLVFFDD